MMLRETASSALVVFSVVVIVYFVLWNASQMAMSPIALLFLSRHRVRHRRHARALAARLASPPLVSVIVPAYNEELTIVESVRALLVLDYAAREIIVVNDGSSDGTLAVLHDAFQLVPAPAAFAQPLKTAAVRGMYRSTSEPALVVVDKVNGGSKSDAVNAGFNAASGTLVLSIDADTLLEPDALSRAVIPFLEDPSTVAVGGNIAISNGCRIENGRITAVALPRSWLARFQIVEYMRAFLLFRLACAAANGVVLISGAFGLFRREAVIAVGGYDRAAIGEDMDLTVRLQRHFRARGAADPDRIRSQSARLDAGARGLAFAEIAAVPVAPRPAPGAVAKPAAHREPALRRRRARRDPLHSRVRGAGSAARNQRVRCDRGRGAARAAQLADVRRDDGRVGAVRRRRDPARASHERRRDAAIHGRPRSRAPRRRRAARELRLSPDERLVGVRRNRAGGDRSGRLGRDQASRIRGAIG